MQPGHVPETASQTMCQPSQSVLEMGLDALVLTFSSGLSTSYQFAVIAAKELTEKAVKDAILKRRTIVYSGGDLIGEEEWLSEFLNAAVDCRMIREDKEKGKRTYIFTNTSSFAYRFRRGKTIYHLEPFQSLTFSFGRDKKSGKLNAPKLLVENMWIAGYKHPVIEFKTDK